MTEKRRLRSRVEQLVEESGFLMRKMNELRDQKAASEKELGDARRELRELRSLLRGKPEPRPARLELEAKMSPEEIERTLRGSASSPIVKAILTIITARMCEDSDRATDRPAVLVVSHDRITLPYTAEDRLHDAGRASSLGDLLGFLQEATKATDESTEKKEAA